ncbi:MAG: hypothetical protein WEA31_06580 [Pirellulales bacterium]
MPYQELITLVPCHSWEDFPIYFDGDHAEGLLAACTAPWHPALIHHTRAMPRWTRADDPDHDLRAPLVMIPEVSRVELPVERAEQVRGCGALLDEQQTRDQFVAAALALLEAPPTFPPDFVADLFALGTAHLLTELLTVQMRYTTMIDESLFTRRLLEAVDQAAAGDTAAAREALQGCFDLLSEARDHFYPIDNYIIDLTLLAPSTIGPALQRRLDDEVPQNLLCSGALLDQIARQQPETLIAVNKAIEENRLTVVGGEFDELETVLLPPETLLRNFRRGLAAYGQHLGRNLRVYGRRRNGLSPILPQLLMRNGFLGGLHFTLDEGKFPVSDQSKVQWEGIDRSGVEVFARLPLDAAKHGNLLAYSRHMGDSMDMDHIAAICYAHWPGTETPWYEDLRRAARYTTALGRFITLEEYFLQTDMSGMMSTWSTDRYRTPYLAQDVAAARPDPISRHVRLHRRRALFDSVAALTAMQELVLGKRNFTKELAELEQQLDAVAGERSSAAEQWEAETVALRDRLAGAFAAALPREAGQPEQGLLTINPLSKSRVTTLDGSQLAGPPRSETSGVKAAIADGGQQTAIVEAPSLGYAWIAGAADAAWPAPKRKSKPLAEENVLRNEHFEVTLDKTTGGVRSVFDYKTRGNRLSQQLALRQATAGPIARGHGGGAAEYSVMAADEFEVLSAGPAEGQIAVRGRLLDRSGKTLAKYTQTCTTPRCEPLLRISIQLEPQQELRGDPWANYYCQRLAWGDPTGIIHRSLMMTTEPVAAKQFESPYFVDIDEPQKRVTLLCGGLPYHRHSGENQVDTLLVVPGEEQREFDLAIMLDVTPAAADAVAMMVPPIVLPQKAQPPLPQSSWLFHLDVRSLVATHWSALCEGEQYGVPRIEETPLYTPPPRAGDDAAVIGFRARLLETSGKAGSARLRCFREVDAAQRIDFRGEGQYELKIDGDAIQLEYGPHDWIELIALWKT